MRQKHMFQMKEQDNTSEKNKTTEISNLPDQEFKVTVIKVFSELRRVIDEYGQDFNRMIGNIKKKNNQS